MNKFRGVAYRDHKLSGFHLWQRLAGVRLLPKVEVSFFLLRLFGGEGSTDPELSILGVNRFKNRTFRIAFKKYCRGQPAFFHHGARDISRVLNEEQ